MKNAPVEKCDVLLTYEIRNREIENLCLIRRELERRGYKVLMRMQYGTFFETETPVEAKVVVVPAYYRERAKFYSSSHTIKTDKIVNMMWEQVFTATDEDNPDFLGSIKPWGRKAVHMAWGEQTRKRLIEQWGVDEKNVPVTGHVALDFLRYPLSRYYMDRDTLFDKYGIPKNKKVHLFISSLNFVGADKRVIKYASNDKNSKLISTLAEVSVETRNILVDWFERLLDETDDIIVYRPHPEELDCSNLVELAKRQDRFLVIGKESVKQWVLACDRLYNWMSTSIAEVYASGKGCTILRPVEIPEEADMRLFKNAPVISTYEDFRNAFVDEGVQAFPIPEETIARYYSINNDKFSYELVADAIEKTLKDDSFSLDEPLDNPFRKGGCFNKERVGNFIKRRLASSSLMEKIHNGSFMNGTHFRENLDNVFYVKNKLNNNYVPEEQIKEIISRIDSALSGNETGKPGQ